MQQDTRTEYINLVQQAQTLMEQMQYADSEQLLMQAGAAGAQGHRGLCPAGGLLFRTGQYQQAVDLLSGQTFEPDPGMSEEQFRQAQAEVQYVLGSCHYQLEEYTDALQPTRTPCIWTAPSWPTSGIWRWPGPAPASRNWPGETVEQLRGQDARRRTWRW